jgi:hypothetical protein
MRVLVRADALERRTKASGRQAGALGQSGLRVLRCLLFDFCNVPSGRCCPSYKAIQRLTGFAIDTIAGALRRLEASGLLRITRRLTRTPAGARQMTNAYAFPDTAPPLPMPDSGVPRGTDFQAFVPLTG